MFKFLEMANNYDQRKVANDVINNATIDTCLVTDSDWDYETAICHPQYNNNNWIIVEGYYSKEDAVNGHEKWCNKFKKGLPSKLKDVNTCEIGKLMKLINGKSDKIYKKS